MAWGSATPERKGEVRGVVGVETDRPISDPNRATDVPKVIVDERGRPLNEGRKVVRPSDGGVVKKDD